MIRSYQEEDRYREQPRKKVMLAAQSTSFMADSERFVPVRPDQIIASANRGSSARTKTHPKLSQPVLTDAILHQWLVS